MFNAIIRNTTNAITLTNLTKLNIGYRVIYAEFVEDGQDKIRAFGRKEFNSLELNEDGNVIAVYPLSGVAFRKEDFFFPTESNEGEDIPEDAEEEHVII